MTVSLSVTISDSSRIGDARREAQLLATELGLSQALSGKIGIVVTEAASNLHKHAHQGQIILRQLQHHPFKGIEVLALDHGPGMVDVAKCLEDGYSTAGSPGTGLGAISRLATIFDLFSQPGKGTVLLAQIWNHPPSFHKEELELGVICLPALEQTPSGDSWSLRREQDRHQILVVDGLGHGLPAAQAADEAVRLFSEGSRDFGSALIDRLHAGLRSTRGAALAVADLDPADGLLRYCGIGNISALIFDNGLSRSLISHNGTVGHELHHVKEFSYPWSPKATLVMHSDGLATRWKLDLYPGLITRHPSVIAGVLYRDFVRGRDDVTVLVARSAA